MQTRKKDQKGEKGHFYTTTTYKHYTINKKVLNLNMSFIKIGLQ